jgi:peptidoglycan/LPS O-acetylase OafA/YrhL
VPVRNVAVAIAVVAAVAALGGVLFAAVHGGTTTSRSVAYALWFAAAGCFAAMLPFRSRRLPFVEGWVFVAGAVALTALGALIDALG